MGKKIQQNSKKKKIVTIAVVSVLVLIGLFTRDFVQDKLDTQRFAQAEASKNTAFTALINGLSGIIRTETQQRCYNSERGPYDNGRLWCEVSSVAYLDNVIPESDLEQKLKGIIQTENWSATNKRAAKVEFEGARDLVCEMLVYDGNLATEPGYSLPNEPRSKQTVIVTCADRAKAKHYPYID